MKSLPCGRPIPSCSKSRSSTNEARFEVLKKKLEHFVAERKLHQSESRIKILNIVAQYGSHFTVIELIPIVAKHFPSVGAATIYRSMQIFTEAGIVRETLMKTTGEKVFEIHTPHHHDHIVCTDCDAIFEFHELKIEKLQAEVVSKLGFQEVRHHHVIYASCAYLD